jgi:hypothetical protein
LFVDLLNWDVEDDFRATGLEDKPSSEDAPVEADLDWFSAQ